MTAQSAESDDLQVERFTPDISGEVSELLLKFEMESAKDNPLAKELGLTFRSGVEHRELIPIVDRSFQEHPELEAAREAMDKAWWDSFSDEQKREYEGNEEFLNGRKEISRYRTVLFSPFASEIYRKMIDHHLEHTDTQSRLVVMRSRAVLGYLAVWNGASTLYLDDHMQVDAKVVDPDLPPDEQRAVVAKFEPVLYDLSLP
jgi:hypothetical protein